MLQFYNEAVSVTQISVICGFNLPTYVKLCRMKYIYAQCCWKACGQLSVSLNLQ